MKKNCLTYMYTLHKKSLKHLDTKKLTNRHTASTINPVGITSYKFLPAGLADLNHRFKSQFKSTDFLIKISDLNHDLNQLIFFIKISDLNQHFLVFFEITNKSKFFWLNNNFCSLFWSSLLFSSTLSTPYRSFIPNPMCWILSF